MGRHKPEMKRLHRRKKRKMKVKRKAARAEEKQP